MSRAHTAEVIRIETARCSPSRRDWARAPARTVAQPRTPWSRHDLMLAVLVFVGLGCVAGYAVLLLAQDAPNVCLQASK